ncbi:MAG: CBS domain-containing protein [Myxococcota bacterium]|nr:CBS domain-containing protein [Myxococcota bacterium]
MIVLEVMTHAPACATPDMPLQEAARMMVDNNCGCIPVIDEAGSPVGVITDRDIVCRTVALGDNPLEKAVKDAMTPGVVTVLQDASIEHAATTLERNQIRRAVVVDENKRVVGIIAQADLARRSEILGGEIVAAVSAPSIGPSSVH